MECQCPNPDLQDTIQIPNWAGTGPYPSVTLRMDFRDPNIAGTFVYHCHILDHEDGGMMAEDPGESSTVVAIYKLQVNRHKEGRSICSGLLVVAELWMS